MPLYKRRYGYKPRRKFAVLKTIARRRRITKLKSIRQKASTHFIKRKAQVVRIQHRAGTAGNIWNIEDPAAILNPLVPSGGALPAESIPNTYANYFGTTFALSDVEQSSDFTNLFDRYKINGVKATFLYQCSEAQVTGSGILPILQYAVDYDDAQPPTFAGLRAKQSCKTLVLQANRPKSIFFKPRKLLSISNAGTGTVTSSVSTRAGWLNSDSPSIEHVGLKMSLANLYALDTTSTQLQIEFVYYLALKDPQ